MIKIEGKTDADAKKGWVYVLYDSAHPLQVKVGMTKRDVPKRVKELATGRATPLAPVWTEYVKNMELVEALVHEQLQAYRFLNNEFFAVAPELAIHVLQVEARPFRLNHPQLKGFRYDMLPELLEKYGRGVVSWDARSLEMLRTSKGIFLEARLSSGVTGGTHTLQRHLAATDPNVDDMSLPDDLDESAFSTERTAKENAAVFLTLDVITQAYLTDEVFNMDAVRQLPLS